MTARALKFYDPQKANIGISFEAKIGISFEAKIRGNFTYLSLEQNFTQTGFLARAFTSLLPNRNAPIRTTIFMDQRSSCRFFLSNGQSNRWPPPSKRRAFPPE